jgi:hypothetical protein
MNERAVGDRRDVREKTHIPMSEDMLRRYVDTNINYPQGLFDSVIGSIIAHEIIQEGISYEDFQKIGISDEQVATITEKMKKAHTAHGVKIREELETDTAVMHARIGELWETAHNSASYVIRESINVEASRRREVPSTFKQSEEAQHFINTEFRDVLDIFINELESDKIQDIARMYRQSIKNKDTEMADEMKTKFITELRETLRDKLKKDQPGVSMVDVYLLVMSRG